MGPLEAIRDFVNTADLEGGEDALADPHARRIREAIRALLRANNGIEVDVEHASRVLDEASRRAGLRVGFADGMLAFRSYERSRLAGVLAALAQTMADGSFARLKACRSDTCQWAFVDNARNHSRQWCDMAVCGNRAKARRFRSRHA
ncbi:MAG TPA: CGNR zinc finger domain-containing protein [Gaiellaceae bacterium]|nr:CGNR zinc finger domain-containing protein [Gaiellaceae bacterium]